MPRRRKDGDFGDPLHPLDAREAFTDALRGVVDAAYKTLREFPKNAAAADQSADQHRPTVFIADVADAHAKLRKRLTQEIGGRATILGRIPPPYPAAERHAALQQVLAQADLSIHLLAASPGREMDDAEACYPHRQADVAASAAR